MSGPFLTKVLWLPLQQKDGKLMPGAKGISLQASDQFSKIQDAADEVSAALEDQDEHYELPLSDK